LQQDVGAPNHARRIALPVETFHAFRRAVHQAFDRRALRAIARDQKANFRYRLQGLLHDRNEQRNIFCGNESAHPRDDQFFALIRRRRELLKFLQRQRYRNSSHRGRIVDLGFPCHFARPPAR
jgi:hypothetical protein